MERERARRAQLALDPLERRAAGEREVEVPAVPLVAERLGPEDPNVFQPEYAARWAELTPYETCVFWWTEVSLFALEVAERLPRVPFLCVRSEEMLAGDGSTLERLAAHMGLSADGWAERTSRRVDRWNHRTDADIDPPRIREHPRALEVAGRLGYTLDEVDPAALRERYSGTPDPGLDRIGRWS